MQTLWRYAWKNRLVAELPHDVSPLPELKRVPTCWSKEEVGRILVACDVLAGEEVAGINAALYVRALVLVFYDTALRLEAACACRTADLDFQGRWLLVRAESQKHRADQCFDLHPDTLAALEASGARARRLLFPYPYAGTRARNNLLRRVLRAAGLPSTEDDLWHKFRRTSCTLIADVLGEEAARRHCGHSHVSVTRRYIDPRKLTARRVTDVLPRPVEIRA